MRDPSFVVFCAFGIVLCLIPLPWHWKAQNSGTLLYLGWTLIGCIVFFVNSIIWDGNLNNLAPVWCDISTKLIVGLSVGIPASSLCINRRLYHIATVRDAIILSDRKQRDLLVDLTLGIGLPVLVMALHYVVQGNRYNILEDIGCWPDLYPALLNIPMALMWPVLIGVASFIYAGLTIRAFIQTRRQFSKILSDSASGLNMSRYFRLMALAATEMVCSLPLSLWVLISDTTNGVHPWISWEATHFNFDRVNYTPHKVLEAFPATLTGLNINRWVTPGAAFVFFLYFGLSGEASREYRRIFWRVLAPLGLKCPAPKSEGATWSRGLILGNATGSQGITAFPSARLTIDTAHYTNSTSIDGDGTRESKHSIQHTPEVKEHDLESQIQ